QNSNFPGVKSNKLGFRASVDAKLTKRLKVSLSVSDEISNSRSYWYKLKNTSESLDNDVTSLIYSAPWTKYFIDGNPVLQNNKFGKNEISVLALYEQEERHAEGVGASVSGVIVGAQDNQNFTNGTQASTQSSQVSNYGRLAYAGRVNYSYADKYLVEVLVRA